MGADVRARPQRSDGCDDGAGERHDTAAVARATTPPHGDDERGTSPRARRGPFLTRIALANPSTLPATALLRFLKTRRDGSSAPDRSWCRPRGARRWTSRPSPAWTTAEFSTIIESDLPLVVDRTMRWDRPPALRQPRGARASRRRRPSWYLAEGATHSGFDLFYLLQNPSADRGRRRGDVPAAGAAPPAASRPTRVGPSTRFNIWVDLESPGGSARSHRRLGRHRRRPTACRSSSSARCT